MPNQHPIALQSWWEFFTSYPVSLEILLRPSFGSFPIKVNPVNRLRFLIVFHSLSFQSEGTVTVRTRQYMTNRLLARRQMVVDVLHPNR